MSPESSDFADPRVRLVDDYQRAAEDLRRDLREGTRHGRPVPTDLMQDDGVSS